MIQTYLPGAVRGYSIGSNLIFQGALYCPLTNSRLYLYVSFGVLIIRMWRKPPFSIVNHPATGSSPILGNPHSPNGRFQGM